MRVAVLICAALLGGCGKAPPKAASTLVPLAPTILDEFLAKPQYSNALEVAFRELPTDSWDKGPKPYNLSRMKRVWQIAEPMFEELKPRLREMSVSNLVWSLKLVQYPDYGTNDFAPSAEYVYFTGNRLIIEEIKTRPLKEVLVLKKLGGDKVTLWEGYAGFGLPLTYQLDEILQDVQEERTNRAPR